jgi:hypothetical protein
MTLEKIFYNKKLSLTEFEKVLNKNDDDGVCMLISIVKMIIARLVRGYFYLKKSIAMTII